MEGSDPEILAALEQKISEDKHAKYKGTAQISIEHLDFPHPCRQVDKKIIEQLKRDFEGEGCIKDQPNNWIPAVIHDSTLQAALEKLATSTEKFKAASKEKPLQLHFPHGVKLECLHGQHRILAAKEFLDQSDLWWTVDLYDTNLENDTKQALREGYSYSAQYASGEIFRYIRLSHYNKDSIGEERWRARLSPFQENYYRMLLTRGMLISALDSVLHIQGLWRTFYVGSLNEFLGLGCDEEIAHCIKYIKIILTGIFDSDMLTMMNTDPFTIESIHSRAPALSRSDFEFIEENMRSREFFPQVTDPGIRDKITQRLLATEELIPSLYTLMSDIRYLKQPAKILNILLPPKPKRRMKRTKATKATAGTLRQRFYFHFTRLGSSDHAIEIQHSVLSYATVPKNGLNAFEVSYQQLWLCSCRVWKYPNAYSVRQLATLAQRLGFSSAEIEREATKDPAQAVIEKAVQDVLHILRPNEKFGFETNQATPLIASFNKYLDKMLTTPPITTPPYITVAGSGEPLARRRGLSCMDTKDLNHLFLDKIQSSLQEYRRGGEEISSFYVKRSRHIAFFGALNLADTQQSQPSPLPSVNVSLERRATAPTPAGLGIIGSGSNSNGRATNSHEGSSNNAQTQIVQPAGPVITFIENNVPIQEVPFEKDSVNHKAREYAHQGKKLHVPEGPHFIWQDCFDILTRTRNSTVLVSTVVEPINGKRRHDQELPDRFQPATKDAFDVTMAEEEEEEEW